MNRQPETLPNGARIKCYDNGGKTLDRYTIVNMDDKSRVWPDLYGAISADAHGNGVLMHVEAAPGRHLGIRVPFYTLDKKIRDFVMWSTTP